MLTRTRCVSPAWEVNYSVNIVIKRWNADSFHNGFVADTYMEAIYRSYDQRNRVKRGNSKRTTTCTRKWRQRIQKWRQCRLLTFIYERQKQWTYWGWCIFGKRWTDVWRDRRPLCVHRNLVLVTLPTIWLWGKTDAGQRKRTKTGTKQHASPGTAREAESFRLASKHSGPS